MLPRVLSFLFNLKLRVVDPCSGYQNSSFTQEELSRIMSPVGRVNMKIFNHDNVRLAERLHRKPRDHAVGSSSNYINRLLQFAFYHREGHGYRGRRS